MKNASIAAGPGHRPRFFLAAGLALAVVMGLNGGSAQAGLSGTSDAVAKTANRAAMAALSPGAVAPRSLAAYDGRWTVRTSPGCVTAGRSTVRVKNGRIHGQGLSGTVDLEGNVRTVGRGMFLTIVSTGRVTVSGGSGVYRQSDGCRGTWSAHKN